MYIAFGVSSIPLTWIAAITNLGSCNFWTVFAGLLDFSIEHMYNRHSETLSAVSFWQRVWRAESKKPKPEDVEATGPPYRGASDRLRRDLAKEFISGWLLLGWENSFCFEASANIVKKDWTTKVDRILKHYISTNIYCFYSIFQVMHCSVELRFWLLSNLY